MKRRIEIERIKSPAPESKFGENFLYTTVLIGATMSLAFWLPVTENAVRQRGVVSAIIGTEIPRVGIDVLTIIAMIKALMHEDRVIVIEKK